jgi:hypothetical protein
LKRALCFLALLGACSGDDLRVPVRPAKASRADVALLDAELRALPFADGTWEQDLGDATFYGLAWLARQPSPDRDAVRDRAMMLVMGDARDAQAEERAMAALGLIEYVHGSGDRSVVPALDAYVDRIDAVARASGDYVDPSGTALAPFGPTTVTAVIALIQAQYALYVGGPRGAERTARAFAIGEAAARAYGDLALEATRATARGYAIAPGDPRLFELPNLAMLLLKARLFRLTHDENALLEARSLYVTLERLKISDPPVRFASPFGSTKLVTKPHNLYTLASQNMATLALLLLFEDTGDERFVDEADRTLDATFAMHGSWCATDARCFSGLLHHGSGDRLARPEDGIVFSAGSNLQTRYVVGYRRSLANEPY